MAPRILIVGAGPAGVSVAETLREHDCTASIELLSAEPFPPYSPPAMADHFLTGREDTLFWKGRDVCERLDVGYRAGVRVASLQRERHELRLEDGSTLGYERLVIASGSRLYAPIAGIDLRGVFDFKSLSAATRLVEGVRAGRVRSAVIVGAGFIGLEVALLLRDLGVAVTVVEMRDRVMPRMLDAETAGIVLAHLRGRGVAVMLGAPARAFVGDRLAEGVELETTEVLRADAFVAATGVKPAVAWLEGSGIEVGWGVWVDDRLRTNDPDVYAAGDVAETRDRLSGERFVHAIFPNAIAQGRAVAHTLIGYDAPYEGAESMNSMKHLGLPVMAVGASSGDTELRHRRGDELRKIFLSEGRIVGFRLTGDVRAAGVYRSLMLRGVDVQPFGEGLLDPRFAVAPRVLAEPGPLG